jgi:hypothetical protein
MPPVGGEPWLGAGPQTGLQPGGQAGRRAARVRHLVGPLVGPLTCAATDRGGPSVDHADDVGPVGRGVVGCGGRAVGRVGAVLQPAVAVRGERYRGGRRDVEAVGQVPDQAVEIGSRRLGDRDRGAHGGPGTGDDERDAHGGQEHDEGESGHDPARRGPAGAGQMAGRPAGQQDDGDGRGQHCHGQRPAADPQHGEGPGTRGLRPRLLTTCHTGHDPTSPPAVPCGAHRDACDDCSSQWPSPNALTLLTPPLLHRPPTSQCRWAKCRNACAAP